MSDIRKTIQKLDEMTAGATGAGSIAGNGLRFASGGIGEKPQKRVKEDEQIRVDKASNFGEWANAPHDRAQQYEVDSMKVVEGKKKKKEEPEADYGDDYQAMVKRVGAKAKKQAAEKAKKKPVSEGQQWPDTKTSLADRRAVAVRPHGSPGTKADRPGGMTVATRVEPTITSTTVKRKDADRPVPSFLKKDVNEMDGDGAGRDGSNRKRIGSYGNRDRDIPGPDVHLGPEHAMKRKDITKRVGDVLNKEMDRAHKKDVKEETEKNPFERGSMGHALWRDLSKTKKASPEQQQRNRERFAKRDAEKATQQPVEEGFELELSEEQLQAKERQRRIDLFKRAKDRELGKKPGDREIQAKESADGVSPGTKMFAERDKKGSKDNPFNARPVDIEDLMNNKVDENMADFFTKAAQEKFPHATIRKNGETIQEPPKREVSVQATPKLTSQQISDIEHKLVALTKRFKELGSDSYKYADVTMPRDREAKEVHDELGRLKDQLAKAKK